MRRVLVRRASRPSTRAPSRANSERSLAGPPSHTVTIDTLRPTEHRSPRGYSRHHVISCRNEQRDLRRGRLREPRPLLDDQPSVDSLVDQPTRSPKCLHTPWQMRRRRRRLGRLPTWTAARNHRARGSTPGALQCQRARHEIRRPAALEEVDRHRDQLILRARVGAARRTRRCGPRDERLSFAATSALPDPAFREHLITEPRTHPHEKRTGRAVERISRSDLHEQPRADDPDGSTRTHRRRRLERLQHPIVPYAKRPPRRSGLRGFVTGRSSSTRATKSRSTIACGGIDVALGPHLPPKPATIRAGIGLGVIGLRHPHGGTAQGEC